MKQKPSVEKKMNQSNQSLTPEQDSLPVCETPSDAEHARPDDTGEPCDDGRRGNISS